MQLYLMNIEQFWQAFEYCGEELRPMGYAFTGTSWVFARDEYTLSFEAPSDRFGYGFQIRYLTLCLAHKDVTGPDATKPWLSDELNMNCPVQISPALLLRFKSARFKNRVWHYDYPNAKNKINFSCYIPVYYGGEAKWILKDKSASDAKNRQALLQDLKHLNIDCLSEERCIGNISSAANAVAEAGKFWADSMSPASVLSQIQRHGHNWWVEKEWIRGYQQYGV
jgi:hypothetical protein